MNYTLIRDEWIGPDDEILVSFNVYDEDYGLLAWSSDYVDMSEAISEFDLNEIRKEIIEQCKTFKLTVDLSAKAPTEWGEEWEEERVLT